MDRESGLFPSIPVIRFGQDGGNIPARQEVKEAEKADSNGVALELRSARVAH
jgi:hypothetical protein